MAKILISSLGAGAKKDGVYEKTQYRIDNKDYEASFIADVLVRHIEIDKLFIVGTKQSIWEEAYTVFGGDDEEYFLKLDESKELKSITELDLEKFNQTLNRRLGSDGSKGYLIDYGINNDEIWGNFETFIRLSEEINDGDELYLDITHSFRSLSMMSFVMTQFASSISDKQFMLKGVYYGMFEYRFETPEKITPIVDLSILIEIQEWIKAIDAIKKYSDFNPLVEILNKQGIDSRAENAFIELNNAINMANMAAIQKFVKNASKKIKAISESGNKVVKLLAREILQLVEDLNHEKLSDFQFALAKWYFNNKNYAMSYMALAEAIVTKNCEIKNLNRNDLSENNQKDVKSIQWPYDMHYQAKYPDSISEIRNNIAHQLKNREEFAGRDIQKLKNFLKEYEAYFKL